jgi:hypothetical protein
MVVEGKIDIEEEALRHKDKLIGRGWEVKRIINVG